MKNILFFGTYQHKIDSKGRVVIPIQWRKHLIENRLYIFIPRWWLTAWNCFIDFSNHEQEDLQYLKQYNLDSQGRICLNIKTNNVLLKGRGHYFTIEFTEQI